MLFIECTYIHLNQKLRHTGENRETGLTSFALHHLSLPYLPASASLCPFHLCCNTSSPPFRYTSLPDSPPQTHPLASSLSPLSSFFANVPFALSLSLPPLPSLPPRAPCFEPGLESVHPEVCHWADVLISGWGNALRRAERGQGPGLGSSAWTCCLHKRWEKLVLP